MTLCARIVRTVIHEVKRCSSLDNRHALDIAKDAPLHRSIQQSGAIVVIPIEPGCMTSTSGYHFRKGQCQVFLHTRGLFSRKGTSLSMMIGVAPEPDRSL
jgi:hypothetical protein